MRALGLIVTILLAVFFRGRDEEDEAYSWPDDGPED